MRSLRGATRINGRIFGEEGRTAEELGEAHSAQICSGFHFPSRGPLTLANSEVRVLPLCARHTRGVWRTLDRPPSSLGTH